MKRILSILVLLLACFGARADIVTATVTVTNIPSDGATIAFGADVRTWKVTVATPSTQIAISNCLCVSTNSQNASNLWYYTTLTPLGAGSVQASNYLGTNIVVFKGQAPLVLTLSSGWGSVTYVTTTTTPATTVAVPFSAFAPSAQTNMASGLVAGIGTSSTNAFSPTDFALINYDSLAGNQTLTGTKLFSTGFGGVVTHLTNGDWTSPVFTNAQNFGNPFRSPGGGTGSEQFGLNAKATTNYASAFGDHAAATNQYSTAIGYGSFGYGPFSTALGYQAEASGWGDIAVGIGFASGGYSIAIGGATASATNSTAIGENATAAFTNSTAIGFNAITTITNQFTAQSAGGSWWDPGTLQVDGGISNIVAIGNTTLANASTNTLAGAITYPVFANSSLANGNNAAVSPGTNVYVKVSGPSGAFAINGIASGQNGRILILQNSTGFTMTIANASGVEPTASNRILTGTGADIVNTSNPGVVTLIYDSVLGNWIVISSH